MEGLGAERTGDPALGRRGHGQRHAAVGHEVLRRPLRSPLAAGRRAHLRVALPPRALPAQRGAARARRAAALGADRRRTTPASRRATAPTITCSACITRSSKRACRSSSCTRRFSTPDRLDQFKLLDPRRRGGAVRRAVRRDPRLRRSAAAASLATFASSLYDEVGPPPRRLRSRRRLRRLVRRARSTARCRTRISASTPIRRPAARHPDPRRPRGHAAHHQRRVPCSTCARRDAFPSPLTLIPSYPDLPMEDVYPRVAAHRHARAVPARPRPQPRRLHPLGHRPHVLGRDVRRPRPAAAERRSRGRPTSRRRSRSTGRACSTSPSGGSATR